MKSLFKTYKKHIAITCFALSTFVLAACGEVGDLGLSGAAGSTEAVETPVSDPNVTDPTNTEPPTPIPPATGHILFTSNRDGQMDLYLASADGVTVERLTFGASVEGSPRLSPDGNKAAYVSVVGSNSDIFVVDLNTKAINQVTNAPEKDTAPSWSPDSQRLAFESFRDGNFEIYSVNVDGNNLTRLTNDPAGDNSPVWSPVSNDIVFVSNRFGTSDLLLLAPNGAVSALVASTVPENSPVWSPNGNFVAYQTFTNELSHICIIGRDGLNQRCITSNPGLFAQPAWSADSTSLAASLQQGNLYSLQLFNVVNVTTTEIVQPGMEPHGTPAWSPDGMRIVFQSQSGDNAELFSVFLPSMEFTQITASPSTDTEPVWSAR